MRQSTGNLIDVSELQDFLGLPNLKMAARQDHNDRIVVEAETINQTFHCCTIQRLGRWGSVSKRRMINDTPHGGFPVMIHLKVHRAQCYECGKQGIRESFDFIQPKKHMTKRLFNHIAKHTVLVGNTNSATGRLLYVSEATARRITHTYIDRHIERLERPTPRVLGIDEKRIARVFRAVLGNIEERTVLNMLPDRAESLERYLRDIPNPEKIEVVCIDQFDGYRTMVQKVLPGRAIVTDRFHVIRKANTALDRIRSGVVSSLRDEDKTLAARLRMNRKLWYCRAHDLKPEWHASIVKWSQRFPVLGKAYWAKERFFDMYDQCDNPGQAEGYYKRWKWTLDDDIKHHFHTLANIQKRWMPHVFAYFEHPFTTGYVESVNRGLNAIAAEGRRYSFETIRGKLMLAETLEKKTFRDRYPGAMSSWHPDEPPCEVEHNWGIDVGLMNRALTARSYTVHYQGNGKWRGTTEHPTGLSTVRVIWDDSA